MCSRIFDWFDYLNVERWNRDPFGERVYTVHFYVFMYLCAPHKYICGNISVIYTVLVPQFITYNTTHTPYVCQIIVITMMIVAPSAASGNGKNSRNSRNKVQAKARNVLHQHIIQHRYSKCVRLRTFHSLPFSRFLSHSRCTLYLFLHSGMEKLMV